MPEYGNYYEAMTDAPQSIDTGNNGWMIKATGGDDTIISGGEDSINAGAGNNSITLKGSAVTVDAADGSNSIFIDDAVKSVILLNYDSTKTTLSGNTSVVKYGDQQQDTSPDIVGDATSVEEKLIHEEIAPISDLPGNPIPSTSKGTEKSSNGDVATNVDDIIVEGNDNYFNTVGGSLFTGSDVVKVDLTKAIDPSNPVPVGGFIVSGSGTDASFVSTNAQAKEGSLVGQVASVYPELMSFTFKGLTLNVTDRRYVNSNGSRTVLKTFSSFDDVGTDGTTADDTGNEYEKYVVASIYKWWMKEGLNLNYRDYGYSFEDSDATIVNINLHFDKTEGGSNALAAVWHSYYDSTGKATSLDLVINKDYYYDLKNYSDVDGGSANTFVYLDRTIAHEFTHAIMAAKDNYFAYLPKFIKEGMAEVTHGIDDKRTYSIQQLAKNADSLSSVINLENEYTQSDYSYAGGYMLLRYLAKQGALQSIFGDIENPPIDDPLFIMLTEDADTYTNSEVGATIMARGGDDTISNSAANVIVNGGEGADSINNDGSKVSINAGAGNDDITNTGSTVTIDTDAGDDTVSNSAANVTISGGEGADSINNGGSKVSINASAGNDDIINTGSSVTIDTGAGDDIISNSVANVTISGGEGVDSINNGGSKVSINADADNDNIINTGSSVTIDTGAGDDTISNSAASVTISGGEGADSINNGGSKVSINAGASNDDIINTGSTVTIDTGAGDDTISSSAANVTINAGDGNDSIKNYTGLKALISAGTGDDSLWNNGDSATIDGGAGDDYIYSIDQNFDGGRSANASISGGEGNDTIINGDYFVGNELEGGINSTISGGAGNDSIFNWGEGTTVDAGIGNDTVESYGYNSKIIAGVGADYVNNYVRGVTIDGGEGNDTIDNYYNAGFSGSVSINGGAGDDRLYNDSEYGTVVGGEGNDYFVNYQYAKNSFIDGGTGNDTIHSSASETTIDGGDGNDIIKNSKAAAETADNNSIKGGAGNDSISNTESNVTINGGAGDDTINNTGNNLLIQYAKGDGNDKIVGFNETSTLDIAGNKYSTTKSGSNLIINVIDSGKITLQGAAALELTESNIMGTFTTDTTTAEEILTLTNSASSAVTLDSTKKYADASERTNAIKITGNSKNNSLVGGKGNDTLSGLTGNDTLQGGAGNDVFQYSAGVDVITDFDSNDKISVVSSLAYKNYAIDGSNVILGFGSNNSLTIEDGVNKTVTAVIGNKTNASIYTASGVFDGKKSAVTLASTVEEFDASEDYTALVTINGTAAAKAVKITGNAKANNISAGAKGSTLNGGAGNDTLTGGNGADVFAYEKDSGNDVIINYGAKDKISLGTDATITDASIKSSDSILKIGNSTLTVKNSTNVTLATDSGDIVYANGVLSDKAKTSATIPTTFAKEFSMGSYKNADSTGRKNAIKITGNANDNSIFGGLGNDTLDGAAGNDTLQGGAGNDVFIFNGGNDVITDYETKDKISVASTLNYKDYAVDGDDLILGYGTNNSLKIANGKDMSVNVNSVVKVYSDTTIFDSKQTAVTLAATSGDFDASDYTALVTIDGAATNAIKITGNAKANRITAGAKGSTLDGGAGNDTLTGGKGADVFAYENKTGNDVVVNYGAGDKISLGTDAQITDASTTKTGDSILKVGSNTLTVKNSSNVTIRTDSGDMIYNGSVFTDTAKTSATLPATFAKEFDMGTQERYQNHWQRKG